MSNRASDFDKGIIHPAIRKFLQIIRGEHPFARLSDMKLVEDDQEFYAELEDGHYIVRLLTPEALRREKLRMKYRAVDNIEVANIQKERFSFLSIRDRRGRPHTTLVIKDKRLLSIRGRKGKAPLKEHLDRLIEFIKKHNLTVVSNGYSVRHILDANYVWHPINNLPDGLEIAGDLNLSDTDIAVLPRGLSVTGNIYLNETKITSLPDNFSTTGALCLKGTDISKLPKGLRVGALALNNTKITCLPDDLQVAGSLILSDSELSTLPDNFTVNGDLILDGTKLTSLPENLKVRDYLILSNTRITSLPESLSVGAVLDISRTQIVEIPKEVSVGCTIRKDAIVRFTG